ncbi:MAG: peptide ABC transporter substrate-binding protein [Chloroflexi bacterium]|nr:MAG: peptide ABC transporter substrate-binding protein [Chloroflexota bacterium]
MLKQQFLRRAAVLFVIAMVVPLIAACGSQAAQQPIKETVVVKETSAPVKETVVVEKEVVTDASFTTAHPILGDVKVRQAIAYCTNRPELIKSVYPFLTEEEQKGLLMDTFLPKNHWAAASDGVTVYDFNPEKGIALLKEAGWEEGANVTTGAPLFLKFTTTSAAFRQTWATVLEQQLADNCGITISRTHAPASWWFGDTTGLARRDYISLYACNQIPLPSNNWEGQNGMGWCNEAASKAIIAANNTLDRDERIKQYAIVQQEFSKDMVSLPLFNRVEAAAANVKLVNFKPNPTEYYTYNIEEWELPGKDTAVLGFTQEPASLYTLVESAAVATTAAGLLSAKMVTSLDYDYQAVGFTKLPKLGDGATNVDIDVKAGDMVWNTAGEAVALAKDVEVTDATGATVVWDGSSPLKLKQLTVSFEMKPGMKWQDGSPVTKADYELGQKTTCDKESGATTFTFCDSVQTFTQESDTKQTLVFLPGVQWPTFYTGGFGAAPSKQPIESDGPYKGKTLADVPAKDWPTLPEVAEKPWSNGPYKITGWEKGQKMTFEANENYYGTAPKIKKIVIQFYADTNAAVAALLTGDVDVLGTETLGAGAEVQTVVDAAAKGKVQVKTLASPTWEHIDFNMFVK